MAGIEIVGVHAVEILDSRSRPTLSVTLQTGDDHQYRAGVPSGASTGSGEAVELRDGDAERYGGKGVLGTAANINGEIHEALAHRSFDSLAALDHALTELDGTPEKSRLGANAIVGVSIAAARAFATTGGEPLWRYLAAEGVAPARSPGCGIRAPDRP